MGMDVYGKNPTAAEGEYFRRNVWGWRPLAEFCLHFAPKECRPCTYWQTNDADGLNGKQALRLAQRLEEFIRDGTASDYIRQRDAALAALPDMPCSRCDGTGKRQSGGEPCLLCNGKGKERPIEAFYSLDMEDVTEFVAFLKACGGFEIW